MHLHGLADEVRWFASPDAFHAGIVSAPVTFRHQQADGMAHDLFHRPAEHRACSLIARDNVAVAVRKDDRVDGRLHQRAELFFTLAQRPLGQPTFGHVAGYDNGVRDRRLLMIGIITHIKISPTQPGHFKPGLVMHFFAFEAMVEMALNDPCESGLAPNLLHR